MNWLFPSGGQIIGISASASVLPVNTQGWFPLGLTVLIFWQSKGLSRVFSTIWKHKSFSMQLSLWSNSHICTWKNHSFDYMDLCRQVMSLLFNMLPRFVIAFLLRSKHLLTSWLQSPFAMIWEPKKKICQCFHFFPFYLLWSDGTRCHYLSFLNTEFLSQLFKSLLSLSSRGSLVPLCFLPLVSAYLRLLIFLLVILIPARASSSLAFCMTYSAQKLNKQDDNIQPWHIPFSILNQSIFPCLVLTIASWPTYRFLRRQVRWSGIPISFRIFYSLLWSPQSKALA